MVMVDLTAVKDVNRREDGPFSSLPSQVQGGPLGNFFVFSLWGPENEVPGTDE